MNTPELRGKCAAQLLAKAGRANQLTVFAGLDGFVDEILHAVDKRDNAESYQRLPTISLLAERIKAAANSRDVPYQSLIKVWLEEKVKS